MCYKWIPNLAHCHVTDENIITTLSGLLKITQIAICNIWVWICSRVNSFALLKHSAKCVCVDWVFCIVLASRSENLGGSFRACVPQYRLTLSKVHTSEPLAAQVMMHAWLVKQSPILNHVKSRCISRGGLKEPDCWLAMGNWVLFTNYDGV